MYPSKNIAISGRVTQVFGLSEEDEYFRNIGDDLDPEYNRLVDLNVRAEAVCVDIGANIGVKAIQLALAASRGRVLAVEAAPTVCEVLRANVAASRLPNLAVEHAAVSDHEGTVRFKDDSAYGHIASEGAAVRATTLEALAARHGLPRVDFAKIDVEGSEFPILRSSMPLFARHGTVVCFEFNTWCMLAFTNDHPRAYVEWLLASFAEVYALRRGVPAEQGLERIDPANAIGLLSLNMFQDGHVTDVVACTAPGRVRY